MATPSEFSSEAIRSEERRRGKRKNDGDEEEAARKKNGASEAQRCDSLKVQDQDYKLGSSDLMIENVKSRMNNCTKNQGHEKFHKVADFTRSHMPIGFQDDQLLELIKVCAALTCFLRVEKFPTEIGSGYITSFKDQRGLICPCQECSYREFLGLRPKNSHWTFRVCTARHVIENEHHVKNTKLYVFYDDTAEDKKTMEGLKHVSTNVTTDFSKFEAVTHDEQLARKLIDLICRRKNLLEEIKKPTWPSDGAIFVISHPHGTCKRVTIGKLLDSKKLNDNEWKYHYSAPTCGGSSGGQVIGIGEQSADDRSVWFAQHTEGHKYKGGIGYFWCTCSPFFS